MRPTTSKQMKRFKKAEHVKRRRLIALQNDDKMHHKKEFNVPFDMIQ